MGFLQFGDKSPKLKVKTRDVLTAQQKGLNRDVLIPFLQGQLSDTSFFGETGLSGTELTSLEGLEQLALQTAEGGGLRGEAAGTLSELLQADSGAASDEFFETNISAPLLEQFRRDIIPGIANRFGGQFFGGERRESEARAREDLIDALTRGRADVKLRGEELDRTTRLQATQQAGQFDAGTAELLGRLSELASRPRTEQEQAEVTRIALILQALGVREFENIAAGLPGQQGLISGAIQEFSGGFGQGLGMATASGCWVARAVYGTSGMEWIKFRTDMFCRAPIWFVRLYLRYGERVAAVIERVPILKRVLRPLMNHAWWRK